MYKVSKKTYEIVMKACRESCVLCGRSSWLELHHVLGRGRYLTDDPTHCVMLCHNCHHNVVHQNLKKYRPILLEICGELYGKEKNNFKEN